MQSALEINGKKLCSIKDAARVTSYSRDYITRLARENKIIASHVGRQWFIDIDSLQVYAAASALEHKIRRQQLSEERKRERNLREILETQQTLHTKKSRKFELQAVLVSFFVLFVGLSTGTFMYQFTASSSYSGSQFMNSIATVQVNTQPALVSESVGSHESASTAATLPATISSDSALHSVQSLGDVDAGILLLPRATTTVTELFSDVVIVDTLPDGTSVFRRLDMHGQPTGNPIPHVSVSLNNSTP